MSSPRILNFGAPDPSQPNSGYLVLSEPPCQDPADWWGVTVQIGTTVMAGTMPSDLANGQSIWQFPSPVPPEAVINIAEVGQLVFEGKRFLTTRAMRYGNLPMKRSWFDSVQLVDDTLTLEFLEHVSVPPVLNDFAMLDGTGLSRCIAITQPALNKLSFQFPANPVGSHCFVMERPDRLTFASGIGWYGRSALTQF